VRVFLPSAQMFVQANNSCVSKASTVPPVTCTTSPCTADNSSSTYTPVLVRPS
jgi:hypothetical protein